MVVQVVCRIVTGMDLEITQHRENSMIVRFVYDSDTGIVEFVKHRDIVMHLQGLNDSDTGIFVKVV